MAHKCKINGETLTLTFVYIGHDILAPPLLKGLRGPCVFGFFGNSRSTIYYFLISTIWLREMISVRSKFPAD